MSAFGGKADSLPDPSACPLIAISGHTATSVRSPKLSRNGLYGPSLKLAIRALDALRFTDVASACTENSSIRYRRVERVRLLRQPRLAQGGEMSSRLRLVGLLLALQVSVLLAPGVHLPTFRARNRISSQLAGFKGNLVKAPARINRLSRLRACDHHPCHQRLRPASSTDDSIRWSRRPRARVRCRPAADQSREATG